MSALGPIADILADYFATSTAVQSETAGSFLLPNFRASEELTFESEEWHGWCSGRYFNINCLPRWKKGQSARADEGADVKRKNLEIDTNLFYSRSTFGGDTCRNLLLRCGDNSPNADHTAGYYEVEKLNSDTGI